MTLPERCPGYTCDVGRQWYEAHRDVPIGDHEYPPGHFWYSDDGHSYMAHVPRTRQMGQVPPGHPDAHKPVRWGEHPRDCNCGDCP